jgi:hypothetical protein
MWVPDLMIGFLFSSLHTTCLNYRHSYSAIAIQHVQQSRFTQQSTQSLFPSLHLWLLTPGTLKFTDGSYCLHSQLHSAIRWSITLIRWLLLSSQYCTLLRTLTLTNLSLPYAVSNTLTLGVLRTLTTLYWITPILTLSGIAYNCTRTGHSHLRSLKYTLAYCTTLVPMLTLLRTLTLYTD